MAGSEYVNKFVFKITGIKTKKSLSINFNAKFAPTISKCTFGALLH